MNRKKYWIDTLKNYISQDKKRFLLIILITGLALYISFFPFILIADFPKESDNKTIYVYFAPETPESFLESILGEFKKDKHILKILKKLPKDKIKTFINQGIIPVKHYKNFIKLIPPTIIINVKDSSENEIINRLRKINFVEMVKTQRTGEDKLSKFKSIIKFVSFSIILIIITSIFILIIFTLKISFYIHKDEINILKLLGASNTFIAVPLLLEGIFIGLTGGFLSVILWKITLFISQNIIGIYIPLNLTATILFAAPIAGLTISFIGSSVSIYNQLNNDK